MRFTFTQFIVGVLTSASMLFALTPPDRGMIEQARKDGTLAKQVAFAKSMGNYKLNPALLARAEYKLKKLAVEKGLLPKGTLFAPPPAWKDMPTTGKVNVLAICIDFNDYPHSEDKNSLGQMHGRIFGNGDDLVGPPTESFRQFYLRSSYGKLDFQGEVLGWYRPSHNRKDMVQTAAGREQLIKEALQSFDDDYDFSKYDNNNDGSIDFFSVIWTGPQGPWASFWWGYQTHFNDRDFKLDGKSLAKYSWQWESRYFKGIDPDGNRIYGYDGPFTPRVLIHEQGHGLGLPDYYDYDDGVGPRGGVGGYDMMAWVGDHNCFSKWLLDWINPTLVDPRNGGLTITLKDAENNEDALIVLPNAKGKDIFKEYYMVQNRQPVGNDANLPIKGDGLVVWHVDSRLDANGYDYVYDNSFTEHKLLRLMEADGLEQIETNAADADAGDFYNVGDEIGPDTKPNTSEYSGLKTYFGIRNISASSPAMFFDLYSLPEDNTPPTGSPTKPVATTNLDEVTFSWEIGDAADEDGKIVGYYLQCGTAPNASDLFDGFVGTSPTKTITNLFVQDGKVVYARVRAYNENGLYSNWSEESDGIVIVLPTIDGSDLDNTTLVFKHAGIWEPDEESFNGASSLHGLAKDNERTLIQTQVVGPGKLSFAWKSSTEKFYDYYYFLLDGQPIKKIVNYIEIDDPDYYLHGEVSEWVTSEITIPAGTHVVSWRWVKDGNTTGELDKVWLDDVQFSAPFAMTTQPTDQAVDAGETVTFEVAVSGGSVPYEYQWYANGKVVTDATDAIYTFTAKTDDNGTLYTVVVTDDVGLSLTSNEAKLTVKGVLISYTETEPNYRRSLANVIVGPSKVTGKITTFDIDVFKIKLKAKKTLKAVLNGTSVLRMDVLNSRGRIIAKGKGYKVKTLRVKTQRNQTLYVRVYYGYRMRKGKYTLNLTY